MPMDPMPRGALAVAIQQGIHTKVKQHIRIAFATTLPLPLHAKTVTLTQQTRRRNSKDVSWFGSNAQM